MINKSKPYVYLSILILIIFLISCLSHQEVFRNNVTVMTEAPEKSGSRNIIDHEKLFFTIVSDTIIEPDCKPMIIPSDAIEFALVEFIKITKKYTYFGRITKAIQIGLEKNGHASAWCIDGSEYYFFLISYNEKEKHLVCYNYFKGDGVTPIVNSIDMSKLP
jgi:hypothetical protein